MSPRFISLNTFSQRPWVTKVRLLCPARARFNTLTLVVSKRLMNGSPQPRPPLALLFAVESPTTNIVGSLGLIAFCEFDCDASGTGRPHIPQQHNLFVMGGDQWRE